MIERTDHGNLVTLRLAHGKASAFDLELCEGLARAFAEIGASDARAVIVTGSGSIFSAGVDLFRLVNEGAPYVERFYPEMVRMFLELFTFPKPVIAAVNGHAVAGGAVLALAADYRLMAAGNGRIGVPEMLVGVPFPPSVLEAIRFAVPPQHLQNFIYSGRTVTAEDALRIGLVDEIVAPDDLPARAAEVAAQMAALPAEAFALTKRQLRDHAADRAKRHNSEFGDDVRALWNQPETHARIRDYLAKTIKK
ncbi:MAG TPA: enoyl-CoA hydratase/isomerase family protein [Thermoanaerobaculia bacterium]|jgi:enoyl-CoA hydratase